MEKETEWERENLLPGLVPYACFVGEAPVGHLRADDIQEENATEPGQEVREDRKDIVRALRR